MTLLSEHDAPPPIEDMAVGEFSFVRNRRPRPRRGPEGARPFDALAFALEDEDKSPSARSTVALLFALRKDVCDAPRPDDGSRRQRIDEACQELARRGFDVELLIRLGLGQQIATAILLGVVIRPLVASSEHIDPNNLPELPSAPAPWAERLLPGIDLDDPEEHLTTIAEQLAAATAEVHPILTWASSATVDDLIDWTAPSVLPSAGPIEAFVGAAPHRWIVDRFLTTYYDDWETSSLHLEWQYLHGGILPPCPVGTFAVRRTTAEEISGIIAERAVKGEGKRAATPLTRYVYAAVDLLRADNRDTAASLFEVVLNFEPTNAEAHNNFGFCLLPDRPADALYHFERAAALGWSEQPFSLANRIYALARLGRFTSALSLADQFFKIFGLTHPVPGWMWSLEDNAKLVDVQDIGRYAQDLVFSITERAGDPTLSAKWAARLI